MAITPYRLPASAGTRPRRVSPSALISSKVTRVAPSADLRNILRRTQSGDEDALVRRGRHPRLRVTAPDVTGLFYRVCMEVAGLGLHVAPIRLTPHPMPVDGLVVGQTPVPGERVRRDSTLTVQVWHPSEPDGQPPAD